MNNAIFFFRGGTGHAWVRVLSLGAALALGFPAAAQEESYRPGASKPAQKDRKGPSKDEGKAIFGTGKEKAPSGATGTWSIVIDAFRGDTQAAEAAAELDKVRTSGGLAQAYLETRGDATVIAFGRYPDPNSKEARADLDRIRGTQVVYEGAPMKPFMTAFLAPPANLAGSRPEYDLRNAKKNNGDWAIYTLQVGVYSREDRKPATPSDLAEFRKMAEEAVVKLRGEGEQAFYYHGPSRSMVTIGLWGTEDYDESAPTGFKDKCPALHALRQRFPNNLQNGMGIKQRLKMTDPKTGNQVIKEQLQASGIVIVPKD